MLVRVRTKSDKDEARRMHTIALEDALILASERASVAVAAVATQEETEGNDADDSDDSDSDIVDPYRAL